MPKEFIISDTHWGHGNIIHLCHRPFENVHQMNQTMLDNWLATVSNEDTVYHLGDVFWSRQLAKNIMPQLTGKIIFLIGNHDQALFSVMKDHPQHTFVGGMVSQNIKQEGQLKILTPVVAFLSHRPQPNEFWSRYGRYHFHGHTHDKMPSEGNRFNVSVEQIGYKPIEILELIKQV